MESTYARRFLYKTSLQEISHKQRLSKVDQIIPLWTTLNVISAAILFLGCLVRIATSVRTPMGGIVLGAVMYPIALMSQLRSQHSVRHLYVRIAITFSMSLTILVLLDIETSWWLTK